MTSLRCTDVTVRYDVVVLFSVLHVLELGRVVTSHEVVILDTLVPPWFVVAAALRSTRPANYL